MTKRIVVLASGSGSNFEAIVKACDAGEISASVVSLISDNPNAKVLLRAERLSVNTNVFNPRDFKNLEVWDEMVCNLLNTINPDLIVLAGFLKKLGPKVVSSFEGKIINTHPALLPKFGGQGMYGMNVHNAVIESKEVKSGITVHFVNNEFDKGRIIAQKEVEVKAGDTADSLCGRVMAAETPFLIESIAEILS